ncbi:hypothetical protein [Mycobacteroides abscessus]|uniref:hypothetical protein n=1 Tax=Mycobacteroides abscessus TaxID=36809 RepID=UPI0009A6402C|nr:hypothetical protein [Mycobacteroides abscessus]MDM3950364.1 adenylosuccinate synthase [Mycobacteroides abscessus]SLI10402.1 Uncharacterised protein [Mycobacteroides abscessus subsp. massiliense]
MTTPRKAAPRKAPAPKATDRNLSSDARQGEAGEGFVVVQQCGKQFRVPVHGKTPMKAILAFRSGDNVEGTKCMLGDEQWATFLETNPTVDDFNELGEKVDEAAGNL